MNPMVQTVLVNVNIIGLAIKSFNTTKASAMIGIEFTEEDIAKTNQQFVHDTVAPLVIKWADSSLGIQVAIAGDQPATPTAQGFPGAPGIVGGAPFPGGRPANLPPAMGTPGGFQGGQAPGSPPRLGTATPGGKGLPGGEDDASGPGRGRTGINPGAGSPYPQGYIGGQGGIAGQQPGGTKPPDAPASTITITRTEAVILYGIELVLNNDAYTKLSDSLEEMMVALKGMAEMSSGRSRIHELSAALQKYASEKGQFPRGTADRQQADRPFPWRPDQRVGFLVELLPSFGQSVDSLDIQKSWSDEKNRKLARQVIPAFLTNDSTPDNWRLFYPGVEQAVGATHFVGIAGVGLDAATYDPNNAAVHKKLGVFGYDRITKLTDITDGREQTIVMIQVPAEMKTPWMAGGGSTIRGVSETNSIAPFVCLHYLGKRGTFAIMADGKVRFLSADLPDDKFKALCTIAGDDQLDAAELDLLAPKVKAEGLEVNLKPAGLGTAPIEQPATTPQGK
jgi:hypothetical protein